MPYDTLVVNRTCANMLRNLLSSRVFIYELNGVSDGRSAKPASYRHRRCVVPMITAATIATTITTNRHHLPRHLLAMPPSPPPPSPPPSAPPSPPWDDYWTLVQFWISSREWVVVGIANRRMQRSAVTRDALSTTLLQEFTLLRFNRYATPECTFATALHSIQMILQGAQTVLSFSLRLILLHSGTLCPGDDDYTFPPSERLAQQQFMVTYDHSAQTVTPSMDGTASPFGENRT